MALSPADIKANYPLPVYNFTVEIDGEVIAFSEISGLEIAYDTITYKESKTDQPGAGPNVMHMPGQGTPVNVSLNKGYVLTKNMPVFFNWISSIRLNVVQKKDLVVRLLDEEGNAVVSWTVLNAFPTKLTAPSFNADSNEVAIEALDLMADSLTMEEN